ncbi:copper resistance protein CopC [Microbacterium sp. LRZ72]|uniref:copper resistance CopC family protein n=1 Tax=Microbacterium sp. LRZ72 TaxID=2942481 RepID=UPI0029A0CDAF|nr:copper resistance protein CopC [Microbacterium sp. LRZ72]MDX2377147.1 copper resistance protein CopC [Microbacterium sp. LRZ72]
MPSPASRRRLPALVAGGLLAVTLTAMPMAASAHDELIGTDPEDGAVLEQAPEAVDLRFSAEPLTEEGGTQVRVIDPTGAEVQADAPETVDNGVIQAIDADEIGTYTVTWRVVSSDGHPISGEFAFSVGEESEPAPAPAPADESDAGSPDVLIWILVAVGGAAVAGAIVVAVIALLRRRRPQD